MVVAVLFCVPGMARQNIWTTVLGLMGSVFWLQPCSSFANKLDNDIRFFATFWTIFGNFL